MPPLPPRLRGLRDAPPTMRMPSGCSGVDSPDRRMLRLLSSNTQSTIRVSMLLRSTPPSVQPRSVSFSRTMPQHSRSDVTASPCQYLVPGKLPFLHLAGALSMTEADLMGLQPSESTGA